LFIQNGILHCWETEEKSVKRERKRIRSSDLHGNVPSKNNQTAKHLLLLPSYPIDIQELSEF
jgi:hypothetical protein